MSAQPLTALYTDVASWLQQVGGDLPPAECHGVLCAMLAVQEQATAEQWLDEILPELKPAAAAGDVLARETLLKLVGLFQQVQTQLAEETPAVDLLLPDDDTPLAERITAVSSWCRGFLYGLGISGISDMDKLPGDLPELFNDLLRLSHADDYSLAEDDEDEHAYIEIVEYIRVGLMMVCDEFRLLNKNAAEVSKHTH